jgi:hypothetical protein
MLADIIRGLHILLILFVILAPFTGDPLIILLNLVIMAGIMGHWILNEQTCCLTVLEKMLRGKQNDSETFFGSLVGPVYEQNSNIYCWVAMIILFIFNLKKLYDKKDELIDTYKIILSRYKK